MSTILPDELRNLTDDTSVQVKQFELFTQPLDARGTFSFIASLELKRKDGYLRQAITEVKFIKVDIKGQDFQKKSVLIGNLVDQPDDYMTMSANTPVNGSPIIRVLSESAPFLTTNVSQIEKQIHIKKFIA